MPLILTGTGKIADSIQHGMMVVMTSTTLVALAGCSVGQPSLGSGTAIDGDPANSSPTETLSPRDFYADSAEAREDLTPEPQSRIGSGDVEIDGPPSNDAGPSQPDQADSLSDPLRVTAGPSLQDMGPIEARPAQGFVIVDGLVGHVNGRPIYVEEFFQPIANEIRIKGQTLPYKQFVAEAYGLVSQRLVQLMQSKLILSEAQGALTEQQRTGLIYFLENVEKSITDRRGLGSRASTDSQLRAETGVGLDEELEAVRNRQLFSLIYYEIQQRVNVTWRDIRKYYRDHEEEFNPPPSIQLRLIVVPTSQVDRIEAVKSALSDGRPFEAVARDHSALWSSSGGLMNPTPVKSTLEETPLTAFLEVDAAARELDEGEYAGPIDVEGNRSIWVYIERYEDGQGRSLYEVQHEIEDLLYRQRFEEEQTRYLQDLMARGSMDDFDQMALGLMKVALYRWAPADAPEDESP